MNRNMNARNFGLRSRDINLAAKNALIEGMQSYSSIATMTSRFSKFTEWEYEKYGVKDMRWVEQDHLKEYARHLADRVNVGELSVATSQNYLSAVNRVMEIARADKQVHIKPTDYLPNRTGICTVNKAITPSEIQKLKNLPPDNSISNRHMAVGRQCRMFGLRLKEASLLDNKKALEEAVKNHYITITKGTKGGRARRVPIRSSKQLESLRDAVKVQIKGRSLIPPEMQYKEWKNGIYRASEKLGLSGWHGGRHLYAQRLYHHITGVHPPIVTGIAHGSPYIEFIAENLNISIQSAKRIDYEAREKVAEELGHGRVGITNSYLG